MLIENYTFVSKKLKDLSVNVYKGKSYNSSALTQYDGIDSINYITRTEKNNGVKYRVLNDNLTEIEAGNAITIGDTTATVFYQKEQFVVGEHIVILRADWINEYTGEFVAIQLQKESFRYPAFARAFIKDCILETKILVPVDENNNISFKLMEKYIKDLNINEQNILNEIPDYFLEEGYSKACWYLENINKKEFENKYSNPFYKQKVLLKDKLWKEFDLVDFFVPELSKGDIKINESIEGEIPLISAINGNNGICGHIAFGDGKAQLFQEGCLTADMFGHVYYQPQKFYSVSHGRVNVLIPKINLNKYQSLFIAKVLEYQFLIRNSYSRMLNKTLLKKCKILLPIKDDGTPDWNTMENFIKSLPFSCNI